MAIVCANLLAHAAIVKTDVTQNLKSTFSIPDNVKVIDTSKVGTSDSSTSPRLYAVCATPEKEKGATRADIVTIYPEMINGIIFIVAVGRDGRIYTSDTNWETWETYLSLPAGTYDFVAMGYGPNDSFITLNKINVNIESGSTLSFDGNDISYTTAVKNYSPKGIELAMPTKWDDPERYCTTYSKMYLILYNNNFVAYAPVTGQSSQGSNINSNFNAGPFSVEVVESIFSKEGVMNTLVQVDFSKSEVGSTSTGWQIAESNFAYTPVYKRYQKYIDANDIPAQSYSAFSLLNNEEWLGTMGSVVSGEFAAKTGIIGFWKPEGYDGPFDLACQSESDVVFGSYEGGVIGLPFKPGDSEPKIMGVNYASMMEYVTEKNAYTFKSVFPYYENLKSGTLLGNSAPMLIIAPKELNYFTFNFIGRYGELFSIDSWFDQFLIDYWFDQWGQQDPELIKELGFPTHTVKINFDGDLVTDNRTDFPWGINWTQSGVYEIEVETNNVLINGEVKGKTKGSVTFDTRINDKIIPTVSAFQVVKKDNEEVTDMLDKPENGFLRIFAGDFQSRFNNQLYYYYCDVTEVDNVTVEYSPTGLGDYKPLEVTKGDLFITPGFGREYTADLSTIDRLGIGGWFDIRITVEDENYSKHVQEICPALNISSMAGVQEVTVDTDEDVEYFNLQGLRIATPQPGELVIERKGNLTRKTMIQ